LTDSIAGDFPGVAPDGRVVDERADRRVLRADVAPRGSESSDTSNVDMRPGVEYGAAAAADDDDAAAPPLVRFGAVPARLGLGFAPTTGDV
jgi:hypothetical protein